MKLRINTIADKELFITLLRSNVISFFYKKIDGSVRFTKASLSKKYVSNFFENKGNKPTGKNNAKPEQVTYWDLISEGWRSPRLVGQTIRINNITPIAEMKSKVMQIESKIMMVNTQLMNIYDMREILKKEKKELRKEYSQMKWFVEIHYENGITHKRISNRLIEIDNERIYLRDKVKKLKNMKINLEKSKNLY